MLPRDAIDHWNGQHSALPQYPERKTHFETDLYLWRLLCAIDSSQYYFSFESHGTAVDLQKMSSEVEVEPQAELDFS
jgi:hypothetical protein